MSDRMEPQVFDHAAAPSDDVVLHRPLFRSIRFWLSTIICLTAVAAVPLAFLVGAVVGETQIYGKFSSRQKIRIEEYLSQHPEVYSGISVDRASSGWAYPIGAVTSQDDYDQLDAKLHEMFGDELAKRMMVTIEVSLKE